MSETTTVACDGCGGTIPVVDLAPRVSCPFCGNEKVLDPRWLQHAQMYGRHVDAEIGRIETRERKRYDDRNGRQAQRVIGVLVLL
jgi:predicted RNA-binding Zn-ribbon protein involved in translation (DUF1610 family)